MKGTYFVRITATILSHDHVRIFHLPFSVGGKGRGMAGMLTIRRKAQNNQSICWRLEWLVLSKYSKTLHMVYS